MNLALALWITSALYIVFTRKVYRAIICFGVFSLLASVVYLFLGPPDVAMTEEKISVF